MASQPTFCPYDGAYLDPDFKFCPVCGHDLTGATTTALSKAPPILPGGRPSPDAPEPPAMQFAVEWDHESYPMEVDSRVRCLLRFQISSSKVRVESHLALVLDVSGSMNKPDKLPLLREALELLMKELHDGLYLTIILFSTRAHLICEGMPSTEISTNIANILSLIDTSPVRFRTTNLAEALDLAFAAITRVRHAHPMAVPRMYVLTDGQLNDHANAVMRGQRLIELEIEGHAFGFGTDFAFDSLKTLLGAALGGTIKHIAKTRDVIAQFRRVIDVAASIVAADCRLEISFANGVIRGDLFAHRPAARLLASSQNAIGATFNLPIGTIEANREYVWALEARLPEGVVLGSRLGNVTLHLGGSSSERSVASYAMIVPLRGHQLGAPVEAVHRIFTSLEDLRDESAPVQIAAYEARIAICREENRDPVHIDAMKAIVEKLKAGVRKADLPRNVVQVADVDDFTRRGQFERKP